MTGWLAGVALAAWSVGVGVVPAQNAGVERAGWNASAAEATVERPDTSATKSDRKTTTPQSALTVRVMPQIGRARAFITVRKHEENRVLRVVIDGPRRYQSSDIPLDGGNARESHNFVWQSLPAGDYTLLVAIYATTGTRARVARRFRILALN